MSSLLAKIGGKFAAAAVAVASFVLLLAGHLIMVGRKEKKAEKVGRALERERIDTRTREHTKTIKDQADDIKDEIERTTSDLDNLRKRMRDAASRPDDQ